jgi:FKBP-type peptidyl-prolyl cis-trans isomerase
MKKFLGLSLAVVIGLAACVKSSTSCQDQNPKNEVTEMQAFCISNGINYTLDSTNILYEIIDPGTAPAITSSYDTVTIKYEGKLLNGTTFDKSDSLVAYAGGFVPGFTYSLQKIKQGGRIKTVIPSAYAYGCNGSGSVIPANSPIYFDVTLIKVRPYKQ